MRADADDASPADVNHCENDTDAWLAAGRRRSGLCLASTLVVEAAAFLGLLWLFTASDAHGTARLGQAILSTAALVGTCLYSIYRDRQWGRSMSQLKKMLPRVVAGELPIEDLASVQGRLAPLMPELSEAIRELRRQRATVTSLEAELQQKVLTRTNALERKIGSLRQQATRDALTGLDNRRSLDEHLPQAVERCRVSGMPLTLLMIDVDNFKKLNDSRGHAAGDELLRGIAQIIRSTIRDQDAAFRCGGDEFVIVLEGFDEDSGRSLASRLMSLVDGLAKPFRVVPAAGLSVGVATATDLFDIDAERLMEQADRALYEIKGSRRRTNGIAS